MPKQFDLLIIGGGSAGIALAAKATNLGAKCAIIEQSHLGGTCSNLGCIPKKLMWFAAETKEFIDDAEGFGLSIKDRKFNWQHLLKQREKHISNIRVYFEEYLAKKKITLIRDSAKFVSPNIVAAGNNSFSAKHIVIATGARPRLPDIPGSDYGITSDDFFLLDKQPKKIAVVGSGYIALELSCILQLLGSEVTLIIRGNNILKNFDPLIAEILFNHLFKNKINIIKQTTINKIEKIDGQLKIYTNDTILPESYDHILWAIGRTPNIDELNLAVTDVQTNMDNTIKIDKNFHTHAKNIYAIGDVTPYPQLATVAIAQGKQLASIIFSIKIEKYNFNQIPTALFTIPPAGMVGLTEPEAIKKYGNKKIKVYQKNFISLYDSLSPSPYPAAIKIICTGRSEKIVGCHIVAREAHEIIQGFAVAINMGATKADFKYCLAIHPTIAEELLKF